MKTETYKITAESNPRIWAILQPPKELIALLRLKGSQWQVQWPEDSEFRNLVGWFSTKTYEQTVEKLKSLPLNIGLKYKLTN